MTDPRCQTYVEQERERNPVAYERARLVVDVTNELEIALEDQGMSQADLARLLGRSRSIISRQLSGTANLSLGKLAELAYAIGKRFEFSLSDAQQAQGHQRLRLMSSQPVPEGAPTVNVGVATLRPSGPATPTGWKSTKHGVAA